MNLMQYRRVRQWRNYLHTIFEEVVGLNHNRRIYTELSEIRAKSPALRVDHFYWAWLTKNYGSGLAIAIRRQADLSKDAISMGRLLDELEKNADALTRDWFVGEHLRRAPQNDLAFWKRAANREFDEFAPKGGSHASAALIRKDQGRLQAVADQIRVFVNRRLAHYSTKTYTQPVTMKDLHDALDALGELLIRYHHLLEQAGLASVEAPIPTDWKAVLRVPWVIPTP